MCSGECLLLKVLWDTIALVMNVYQNWRTTKWVSCDVDGMIASSKELQVHVYARVLAYVVLPHLVLIQ